MTTVTLDCQTPALAIATRDLLAADGAAFLLHPVDGSTVAMDVPEDLTVAKARSMLHYAFADAQATARFMAGETSAKELTDALDANHERTEPELDVQTRYDYPSLREGDGEEDRYDD